MIHYALRCEGGHGFDGWFKDSAAFSTQAASGLIACPDCGSVQVGRGLMAPALGRKSRKAVRTIDQSGAEQGGEAAAAAGQERPGPAGDGPGGQQQSGEMASDKAGAVMPDRVRAVLQRLRAEVERNCEHVGENFAAEARRIHNGESAARGIYGETTPDEAQSLSDDGIDVARLPWIDRADG